MTLQERCKKFTSELGIPTTKFCSNIKLSRAALIDWQNGKLNLSQSTLDRIDEYLKRYGF